MTTTQAKTQLASVREHLRVLLEEGRTEEALELTLATVSGLQERVIDLTLRLAKEREQRAGRRSETIDPAQLALMMERVGELEEKAAEDMAATEREDEILKTELTDEEKKSDEERSRRRRRPRRRRPPKELPREIIRHELSAEDRVCKGCGQEMAEIGEDISETLEYVPAHFRVEEHHRVKYACGRCKETVATSPGPEKLIEKGLPGPGLLAHVVLSKYMDHVPLNRLAEIYGRSGVEIATSTLCGWVGAVAEEVSAVVDRIWEKALAAHALQTDGSGLKVLDRDHPQGVRKGTMWCFAGDEKYVVFRYAPTGAGEDGPWRLLEGRKGKLQADASNVFDRLYNGKRAEADEVGCWAHARRKYYLLRDTDVRVAYPLKLIAQLYRVEELADRRELSPEKRLALRRERSVPILERYERWLKRTAAQEPPESALHKACAYSLNQWKALGQFLEDPCLPLDNNFCERQIRSLALGRRNYLFAGSDAGAEHAAILYSLVRTAALAGIDTYGYLVQLIGRLAGDWHAQDIDELLPENYVATSAN